MIIQQSVFQSSSNVYDPDKLASYYKTVDYDMSTDDGITNFIKDMTQNNTSPIIFKNGYRKGDNFISADHTVLDFDEGFKLFDILDEIENIQPHLTTISIPSRSHNMKKDDKPVYERYHIALIFSRKITTEKEYKIVTKYLIEQLTDVKVDTAVKDSGRFLFPSYYSGESIRPEVQTVIDSEIEIQISAQHLYGIQTLNVENIIKIVSETVLNDNKTLNNEKYKSDITNSEIDKVKLESAVNYLKTQTLNHPERWYIACCLNRDLGFDEMKNILLSIDNSPGNSRIINELQYNGKKYNENGLDKFYGTCVNKGWSYSTKKEDIMDSTLVKEELDRIEQIKIERETLKNTPNRTESNELKIQALDTEEAELNQTIKMKTNITPYQTDMTPKDGEVEYFNSFVAKINGTDDVVIEMKNMVIIKSIREATSIFEDIGYYDKKVFHQSFMKWRQSSDKRTIYRDQIVYKTHSELLPGEINTFRQKYAVKRVKHNQQSIKPILDYIFNSLCDSNEELYKFMTQWIAAVIQYYSTKVLIINIGDKGTGKTTLFELLLGILGDEKALIAKDERQLLGNFNKLLENKIFLTLDEIADLSDKRVANGFKSLITGSKIIIEPKGRDAYSIPNTANWYIASNGFDTNNVDLGDRRYVVLSSSDKYNEKFDKKAHDDMFESVYKIIGNSKYSADQNVLGQVLDYFLEIKVNLNTFLENIPITNLKREIKSNNLDSIQSFLATIYIEDGKIYDNVNKWVIDVYNNKVLQGNSGEYDGDIVVKTQMIYDVFKHLTNDRKTSYNPFCKRISEVTTVKQLTKSGVKVRQFDKQKIYEYFKILGLETYLLD